MPDKETLESPLFEFNSEHPSISISDIQSPSNFTYYPWTLPPELIPANATSSKMAMRTTFDLSFPTLPNIVLNVGALQRVDNGILVSSMSGMRLGMIRESDNFMSESGVSIEDKFRIHAISNVALGRDEKVFMSRDIMDSFNPVDPFFTRTRDTGAFDLVIDAALTVSTSSPNSNFDDDNDNLDTDTEEHDYDSLQPLVSSALANKSLTSADFLTDFDLDLELPASASNDPSYVRSLLQSIQSILSSPTPPSSKTPPPIKRHKISGTIPSGPGAAPLPDKPDADLIFSTEAPLAWHKVYVHDSPLCTDRLPFAVARDTQILVIPRGGCSFSQKLRNIPAYPPDASSLQLVIVVSYPEHDNPTPSPHGPPDQETAPDPPTLRQTRRNPIASSPKDNLVQPLLDEPQYTPSGLLRPHQIPMVMVGGGQRTMELLRRAEGVGVRRRYYFRSQGVRIGNLIVL
jgi:hypothetical protein